jgi:hypothetical protein
MDVHTDAKSEYTVYLVFPSTLLQSQKFAELNRVQDLQDVASHKQFMYVCLVIRDAQSHCQV